MAEARQVNDKSPLPAVHWAGRRVVLASSDLPSADTLFQLFSAEGMEVLRVNNAGGALQVLSQHNNFDLLVIDTELRGGD